MTLICVHQHSGGRERRCKPTPLFRTNCMHLYGWSGSVVMRFTECTCAMRARQPASYCPHANTFIALTELKTHVDDAVHAHVRTGQPQPSLAPCTCRPALAISNRLQPQLLSWHPATASVHQIGTLRNQQDEVWTASVENGDHERPRARSRTMYSHYVVEVRSGALSLRLARRHRRGRIRRRRRLRRRDGRGGAVASGH